MGRYFGHTFWPRASTTINCQPPTIVNPWFSRAPGNRSSTPLYGTEVGAAKLVHVAPASAVL